ncbi:MAG: polysaccharide deacetylase family protein, partial [Oscillospiraceae bacterium]|nr:polysaccharide deacetylase family protein [Oscillospiraceae bacterium]
MRMFGEESEYIPADFGRLVTKDNVPGAVAAMYSASGEPADNSAKVPILTYHHITDTGNGDTEISEEAFRAQMAALSEMGYTSVFFSDLESYVNYGTPLPEKPVVITFDDGYMSNYSRAFPILEEYGMKAT